MSAKPERIQLSRRKGWRLPEGAVSVARPTKWGNPFAIGEAIDRESPLWPYIAELVPGGSADLRSVTPMLRDVVVSAHGSWFIEQPGLMLTVAKELGGKDLACWCPLFDSEGRPVSCHADLLLELANGEDVR